MTKTKRQQKKKTQREQVRGVIKAGKAIVQDFTHRYVKNLKKIQIKKENLWREKLRKEGEKQ